MPPVFTAERAPLVAWQVESLRLTVFPNPLAQIKPDAWWHDVTGEDPESSTSQPKRKTLIQEGAIPGGRLILRVEPSRIDWRMLPVEAQPMEPDPFPSLGVLPDVLPLFHSFMNRWFDNELYPPVKRLAFGAILLQPVETRQAGYERISAYLPSVSLDAVSSSDFMYRINRRRASKSGVADFQINRLSTWAVRATSMSQLEISLQSAQHSVVQVAYACGLELDINTIPEYLGEFSAKESRSIFQELIEFGVEIAREGDIP